LGFSIWGAGFGGGLQTREEGRGSSHGVEEILEGRRVRVQGVGLRGFRVQGGEVKGEG
jgi:hypothetical protein